MKTRLDWYQAAPALAQGLLAQQELIERGGLDHKLLELVKLRASQINGCAFCIDMHTKDARAAAESEQRLYLLSAWREAPQLYTSRERAALAWTEALTNLHDGHVPDEVFATARAAFDDAELASLSHAICQMNTWNRLNVAFRRAAGDYRPGMFRRAASGTPAGHAA